MGVQGSKPEVNEHNEQWHLLRRLLRPGSTVYCVVRHTSPTGMSGSMSLFYVLDGVVACMDYSVSVVLGWRRSTRFEGLRMAGGGSHTHWAHQIAEVLGDALWMDEHALKGVVL